MKGATENVRANIQAKKSRIHEIEAALKAQAVNVEFEDVGPALALAKDYRQAAVYPPFGEMWNYLASLRPQFIRVDGMEFKYIEKGVHVHLEGQVEMDITMAQQGFTSFTEKLEKQGFKVVTQQVNLDLEGNYYSLDALWPLKKKGE